MALLVSSLPLSLTTIFGLPRSVSSRSSSRARVPRERGVGLQRQPLTRVVIDYEDAEAAAIGELIQYEVPWLGRRVCIHGTVDKAGLCRLPLHARRVASRSVA